MNSAPTVSWRKLGETVGRKLEETLERWANRIKDLLLDWESVQEGQQTPPVTLPPLDADAFLAEVKPRLERVVGLVVDLINACPSGQALADAEDQVTAVFQALAQEVFAEALERRVDAALESSGHPASGWGQRYRRMKIVESALPSSVHDSRA